MKIQPQSGLGDLIFSLPLIYELSLREDLEISTNHGYALERIKKIVPITTAPVEIGKGNIPIINTGYTHLRYDLYGPHYFDTYYPEDIGKDLKKAIFNVRRIYRQGRKDLISGPYIVYALPRAANRHTTKDTKYSCTPNAIESYNIVESYDIPVVLVGKDEILPAVTCQPKKIIDLRNLLDFESLCDVISNCTCVISQISAITTLAGLFGKPTHFLKAASETEEQHEKHICGVIWPGQQALSVPLVGQLKHE
jgi:hypothetical protein